MSHEPVRQLIALALWDPNIWVADEAFLQLELYDFHHAARPGECIEIVPAFRKSARWTSEEARGISFGGHFRVSFTCIPEESPTRAE